VLKLELCDTRGELSVVSDEFAEPDEGANDVEAHVDRTPGVEDGGEHRDAVFGEGVGLVSPAAPS
jgi:hypothetical protein